MMQEVGKVKITCGRILSIQSQLGGLSFYCRRDKKYSFRQIRDIADIAPVITKELFGEDYDEVNFYHNSLDYIIIPRELFDENMCDAYLLSKGIVQSDNKVISVTLTDSLAYVSMIERDILVDNIIVNVFPIVAKTFLFCSNYDCDIISYVIVDNILHISYGEGHMIKFCDSLPLVSVNDFEFFVDNIIKRYKPNRDFKIISLYENGNFAVGQKVISKYNIKKILQENYFEI